MPDMSIAKGKLPGFSYTIGEPGHCAICDQRDVIILKSGLIGYPGICEPCAHLTGWAWREVKGAFVPGAPLPTHSTVSLVLLIKERQPPENFTVPFDVLMVGRKDDKGKFGLPGGKTERGETPEETASRELKEETTIIAYPSAMEKIYSGYDFRCRLLNVFLCRAYSGESVSQEGMPVVWKPYPFVPFTGMLQGLHQGIQDALDFRVQLHKKYNAMSSMTHRLTPPAAKYMDLYLPFVRDGKEGDLPADDNAMINLYAGGMNSEDKEVTRIIIMNESKFRDAKALITTPRFILAPHEQRSPMADAQGAGSSEADGDEEAEPGDEDLGGGEGEEGGENENGLTGRKGGFVR